MDHANASWQSQIPRAVKYLSVSSLVEGPVSQAGESPSRVFICPTAAGKSQSFSW